MTRNFHRKFADFLRQLIECIRPILPSIRNTPYGKRIQSKLAREDASFSTYGPAVGGVPVGPGGRGGFRGAGGMGAGGGGFHRHLGRPQLQHINALTEVYGSQTGYVPQGPTGYGMQAPVPSTMAPTHTGLSYHAPGPDGQPWLHLRGGPGGGPASNWSVPLDGQDGSGSNEAPSQDGQLPDPSTMWPNPQQFMPFLNDRSGTHNPSQRHVAMM